MLTLARGAISARGFCNPLVSASSPTAPPPPHCTRPGHSAGERAAPQCVAGDTNKPRWRQLSSNCWDPTLRRVPTPANSVAPHYELWHHTCSVLSRGVGEGKLLLRAGARSLKLFLAVPAWRGWLSRVARRVRALCSNSATRYGNDRCLRRLKLSALPFPI